MPFADGRFPTPSGKVELRCEAMAALGLDPLPDYQPPAEFVAGLAPDEAGQPPLVLITGAAHHFVTTAWPTSRRWSPRRARRSSRSIRRTRPRAQIEHGEDVMVANERGWCTLRAVVTDDVPPGVAVSPKGRWASLSADGRNVNWLTSDALADLAGQSTFHSNLVHVRPATAGTRRPRRSRC